MKLKPVKMTKQHIFIIENNLQKVGLSFFHLSHRTTVIQDLLVRRQFSLVPDNRTNVNVEACSPTGHIILITSLPVFALIFSNCMLKGEATNINFIVFGSTRLRLEPTIYDTGDERASYYTTDAAKEYILERSIKD